MADLDKRSKVLAVGGPTASGKTSLSVFLARELGGEILSADSMQIYRGLDIGTAKATAEEQQGVPHHLLDICPPEETYSVADYVGRAGELIGQISGRGHLPIVAGGTGLYITSLLEGIRFAPQNTSREIREKYQALLEEKGAEVLYRQLEAQDPEAAAKIHPHNKVRLVRALEACELNGTPFSQQQRQALPEQPPYRSLLLCIDFADRQLLYRRIDLRVEQMLEQGLLEEARLVFANKDRWKTAAQAIGYKEFFGYFEGTQTLEEAAAALKQASRHYAKRQLTWFRHRPGVCWLEGTDPRMGEKALALARDFCREP